MAKGPVAKPGIATMTKSEKNGEGVEIVHPLEQEVVKPPVPVVNPCTVGVDAGKTIPVGNYANVKIGVFLSLTVEAGEIDEAFDFATDWVSTKLGEMEDGVLQAYGGQ